MAISSADGIALAMATPQTFTISKASVANATAGGITSLFRATGIPAQPSIPSSTWATPVDSDTGFPTFVNPVAPVDSYLVGLEIQMATAGTLMLFDRLGHNGGLSGTVTTAQTVNGTIPSGRLAATDGSDVEWWLEWYTDTGGTAVTATISYTNQSDTAGRTCTVALAATMRAGRMLPIQPTTAGDMIKSIQSVTLSATTGTAGSFGVTLTKRYPSAAVAVTNLVTRLGPFDTKIQQIPDNAALFGAVLCSTTSTGLVQGLITLGQA